MADEAHTTLEAGFYWAELLVERKVVVIEWIGGHAQFALVPGSDDAWDLSAFRILSGPINPSSQP